MCTVTWSRNDKRGRCWWTVARGVCFPVCELETESDIPCTGLLTSWYSSNLLGSGEIKLKMNCNNRNKSTDNKISRPESDLDVFHKAALLRNLESFAKDKPVTPLRSKNVCVIHYSSQSVNNVFNRHSYSSKVDSSLSFLCLSVWNKHLLCSIFTVLCTVAVY